MSNPLEQSLATCGHSEVKCTVTVKYTLDFKDLTGKKNVKYLIIFMLTELFWVSLLILGEKLILPVHFHLFLNVLLENSKLHVYGSHYISIGQNWSRNLK